MCNILNGELTSQDRGQWNTWYKIRGKIFLLYKMHQVFEADHYKISKPCLDNDKFHQHPINGCPTLLRLIARITFRVYAFFIS